MKISMNEIKKEASRWKCMECGKVFNKNVGPRTFEIRCPKCGSIDVDLID